MELNLNFHADLIYHVLAHMDIGSNNSNLYLPAYIEKIKKQKERLQLEHTLEQQLKPYINMYLRRFETLSFINFIPFYAESMEEIYELVIQQSFYTEEEKREFLLPFLQIAEKEKKEFYYEYWASSTRALADSSKQFCSYWDKNISKFASIIEKYKLYPKVYLSSSMTRNGRALERSEDSLVVIPAPTKEEDFSNAFIQGFHEITHMFTNPLMECDISMENCTHSTSEALATLMDFYLFQKLNPDLFENYCKKFAIENGLETKAKEKYPISPKLMGKMEEILCYV